MSVVQALSGAALRAGVACAFALVAVCVPTVGLAQDPPPPKPPEAWTLEGTVNRVLAVNPLIEAYDQDVRRARVDLEQLHGFWSLPEIKFDGMTGLVPEARGNVFSSPDTANDLGHLGPFYRGEFSIEFPILNFGRLGAARGAVNNQIEARTAQRERGRDELGLQTVQTYWGLVAAEQAVDMATSMLDNYEGLLEEAETKLESADIDANDLWEIRTARYDLETVAADAEEAHEVLGETLRQLLELPVGAELVLSDREPPAVELSRDDLASLQATARAQHPQLRAVRAGVAALEDAVRLETANRWPLVLVGGGLSIARSSVRADQRNPFVYDEFNFNRIALAVNMRWDLNFARHNVSRARRRIERDAMEARAAALEVRIDVEVAQKLERVLKSAALLETARQTARDTRRWVRSAGDDFDLGLGEAQPLIKAFRADYRLQAEVVRREYEVSVALAELALATGGLHSYLQWVVDGRVALATSRSADASPGYGGGRPGHR